MSTPYNPVGWFEIYIDDLKRATQFYQTVLHTTLQELPMPDEEMGAGIQMMAFPMHAEAKGASGALTKMEGMKAGGNSVFVYFSCEDCAIEESRVEAAGGRVHTSKMSIGQYGYVVMAIDTEGNMFGLHSQQ